MGFESRFENKEKLYYRKENARYRRCVSNDSLQDRIMKIKENEARHIARYLYLGAFERGNREISITIGEKAEIGVKKHVSGKYVLFVKKDNKIDKKAGVPTFSKNITNDDLARLVVDIINNSVFLIDTELDMKKIPAIPSEPIQEELLNPEDMVDLDDFSRDDVEEYVPKESPAAPVDECLEEDPESEESEEESEEDVEGVEETEEDPEEETKEKSEEKLEEKPEESLHSRMKKYLDDDDPLFKLSESELDAMFDDDDPKVYYEKIDVDGEEAILIGDPNFDYPNDDNTDCIDFDDLNTDCIDFDDLEAEDSVLVQKTRHKHITNNSYLVQVMGDNEETLNRMTKVNERLISLDKGKATELYVRALTSLVSLYDNDVEQLAKDIKIDERDIILALYEGQFCNC